MKLCGLRDLVGFPGGSAGKESTCDAGDLGSIPGLGRSPGEGEGYSLPYSALENSMDCRVHEVAESDTTERLSHTHNLDVPTKHLAFLNSRATWV